MHIFLTFLWRTDKNKISNLTIEVQMKTFALLMLAGLAMLSYLSIPLDRLGPIATCIVYAMMATPVALLGWWLARKWHDIDNR